MAFQSITFYVLIASPGDLAEDRDEVERQVHRWNVLHAEAEHVTLVPLRWETSVRPTYGAHPQKSINAQIVQKSDCLIGMFWHRIGTKTDVAESGTVEEIDEMATAGKEIMLYFSNRPVSPSGVDQKQLKALTGFKKGTRDRALTKSYDTIPALREMVFDDITRCVRDLKAKVTADANGLTGPANGSSPAIASPSGAAIAGVGDRKGSRKTDAIKLATKRRRSLEKELCDGSYRQIAGTVTAAITILPLSPAKVLLATRVNDFIKQFKPLAVDNGWTPAIVGRSVIFTSAKKRPSGDSDNADRVIGVTEVFEDGVLFAAMDFEKLTTAEAWARALSDQDSNFEIEPKRLAMPVIEQNWFEAVRRYVTAMRQLGVTGDVAVGLSMFGCRDYQFQISNGDPLMLISNPVQDKQIVCDLGSV